MVSKLRLLFLIFCTSMLFSSCKMGRFVYYNWAGITDYKIFPSRKIENDSLKKFTFEESKTDKAPDSVTIEYKGKINRMPFDNYLDDNKTVAFLMIRNDSIISEKYFSDYDASSIVASFSMAKSVNSILIGIAIDEGLIKSVDEPITNYLPDLKKNGFEKVTIKHLLQMTSGIDFNESYSNPFGEAAGFYYGRNLKKEVSKLKMATEPGTKFAYSSGDSQILGMVLESALKGKSISDYLEEKIWKPLGMEFDASWSLDKKEGIEKTFCCLNARARDFAKIGRLYLNKGKWEGKQIVSEKWVALSTKPEIKDGSTNFYQYQWWFPSENGDFMAEGILGQYIYVNPKTNVIIVRLGKAEGKTSDWETMFMSLANKK
jgi:CubicO group peptidase (beta-lactamase class C family)